MLGQADAFVQENNAAFVTSSSQLENSVRYHFQVVFTSGELGNFKASPFVPLGFLDLVSSLFGPKYAENSL